MSEATFFRWKEKYQGMTLPELKAHRQLEEQNRTLRHQLTEVSQDNEVLKGLLAQIVPSVSARRGAVQSLIEQFDLSERHACELVGLQRSSWRYEARAEEPAAKPLPANKGKVAKKASAKAGKPAAKPAAKAAKPAAKGRRAARA